MVLRSLWWGVEMCMMEWSPVVQLGFPSDRVTVSAGGVVSCTMVELSLWWGVGFCRLSRLL